MESSYKQDLKETETHGYRPNKAERMARHHIWSRYTDMQGDTNRKEAEAEWEEADKMFRMWTAPRDPDDWRANFVLPDGFAAVQADMQERIERKSRPYLKGVERSDLARTEFANAILKYNLDVTDFDYQHFLAKYAAAIRGTSFMIDNYRYDKRKINDAVDVDKDGNIVYEQKEIVDFDDDDARWIANEYVFVDESVDHISKARDCIVREIINIHEFKRKYNFKKDFINVDKVQMGGDTGNKGFFTMPHDMTESDVEVLHYYNRATDEYNVLANNVIIRLKPMPTKHKELPVVPFYHYYIPGRFYGYGIPQVIRYLTEERRAIRMLNLDRQKMQIDKMFLVNRQFDLDEEDTAVRPHGFIEVDTQGAPLNNVIQPLEYGDVPPSYFRTEEVLLEDLKRAHGIDDRLQGVNQGGTATEAAILKEESQKRINMISQISEMDSLTRLGKLKWSNIQFFYKAPKVEKITQNNKEVEEKTYRKITIEGKDFTIKKNDKGQNALVTNDISGDSTIELKPAMARFMEGDFDVIVDPNSTVVVSKVLRQAKITEMVATMTNNPLFMALMDPKKAFARYVEVNDEMASNWMKTGMDNKDQAKEIAEMENMVMMDGIVLAPTENATEEHTAEHIDFTKTADFQGLPQSVQQVFHFHIQGEIDSNPALPMSHDMMGQAGGGPGGPGGPPPGVGGPQPPAGGGPVEIQPADITPSTVMGGGQ